MSFIDQIHDNRLKDIAEKVSSNIPVDERDALTMLSTPSILDLGVIADHIRTKLHRNITYYGVNMNLNYTNICELRCPLCAFSCDKNDPHAFLLPLIDIEKRVRNAREYGIDEVHIVGGLHPELTLDYFEDMLRIIKRSIPGIHIVAFTAVEYDYFAKTNKLPVETILRRLMKAGVNALPGGGAEIFEPRVRRIIAPKKISGERWLDIMKAAHAMGLKTNATMLYNHIESQNDIVDHLFRLREAQDETGGFKAFVPLPFHGKHTSVNSKNTATGYDDIRIYATSRIVLDNIPHIKALWMYLGEKMAQVLQKFGVDDIGATYHNEKVVHAAGADTPDFGSEPFLKRLITKARFTPVRTAADYRTRPSRP